MENPTDYEARSNIMWTATWALNTLVAKGKTTDWMVHMLGQAVAAHTDATHGMTLAAVTIPYYKYILPYGTAKFCTLCRKRVERKPQRQIRSTNRIRGIGTMNAWMKKIGLVMNITELGATKEMLDGMVKSTLVMDGGYKVFNEKDIRAVLQASF